MSCTLDSPSAISVNALIFTGGEVWNDDEPDATGNAILQSLAQPSVPGPSGSSLNESCQSDREQNVSTYVRVFEDMVGTVIKEETHLLDDEEFSLLTVFAHLSYNARFLMVKLLLRKPDTWHRLDTLKYERELGSVPAIIDAIDELCKAALEPSKTVKKEEQEEQGIIDSALKDLESATNIQRQQNHSALVNAGSLESSSESRSLALARGEQDMDLKCLLECLRVDELKDVAKQLKLKTKHKKDGLIDALLSASSSQSTLTEFACGDGLTPSKNRVYHQTKLSFGKLKSQQDRLRDIVLQYIVKCVRVDEEFFGVIHRVNLVYFRITQFTPNILVAALLTQFGKRAYPGYKYERTRNIWPSRQALLDYEEVLTLEGKIDVLLSGNVPPLGGRAAGSKTPAVRCLPTPGASGNVDGGREEQGLGDEDILDVKLDTMRVRGARMVKDTFESVYPRWQDLVKNSGAERAGADGLERFHHGHVLTRIVWKGSTALGVLGEHEQELGVLEALLAQKKWRIGQRGRWHERHVRILSTHLPKTPENVERAFDAVTQALLDPCTHIVYRPKLERRLRKLENKLKIPAKDRHTCDGILVDADEVTFEAVRLKHRAAGLKLDRMGRCTEADASPLGCQNIKRYYSPLVSPVKPEHSPNASLPSGRKSLSNALNGKSIWLGRNGEEMTVENLALQRYEEQGFKGVHCETRVIAMLFAVLFWDIIFESIPGAFETPYQTAPLDIAEDSFYHARKDLMEKRLVAIEAGEAADFVRAVDANHRTTETWCIGVRWDLFSSEDLVDVVTCIGGQALSAICRVLCEDYTLGTSGGPDLFLWDTQKGTCKFVEVKGPGDVLRENQRVWIDILLRAPVPVEICRVEESGAEADKKPNMRTPKSSRKKAKKTPRREEEMFVDADSDADTLPNIADDPHAEEQSASAGAGPSISPMASSACAEGSSGPLKRKAGPRGGISSTPSKRQRTS